MYSLKSNSSVRVGRLYTVQGYSVKRWTGAEIQLMLFSRVIDRGGACVHLEKDVFFHLCAEASYRSAGTQEEWAQVKDWVVLHPEGLCCTGPEPLGASSPV